MASPVFTRDGLVAARRNLDKIDVFLEGDGSNPMFFAIGSLPEILSYGKHYFTISIKDSIDMPQYTLKGGSELQFEFLDVNDNIIFSDTTEYAEINGMVYCYVWIKEDPLRTFEDISDGFGKLIVVGELINSTGYKSIPERWKKKPNYRCVFPIDVRKNKPNTSPILFSSPAISESYLIQSKFCDSVVNRQLDRGAGCIPGNKGLQQLNFYEPDKGGSPSSLYERSYINVSASHLQTYGGIVDKIELSYRESSSLSNEYKIISTYNLSGSEYEITGSLAKGLNSLSDFQKFQVPTEVKNKSDIYFKLRFLNPAGEYAQDILHNRPFEVSGSIIDVYNIIPPISASGLHISGAVMIEGSLTVTHFTSSYITSSVTQIFTEITSSGNSLFGDANTDNHRFLGNVGIQGYGASSISHSVDGLTVAGDISASGDIFLKDNSDIVFDEGATGNASEMFIRGGSGIISFLSGSNSGPATTIFTVRRTAADILVRVGIGNFNPSKTLTVEGSISASGVTYSSASVIGPPGTTQAPALSETPTPFELTVAGDISASGALYIHQIRPTGSSIQIVYGLPGDPGVGRHSFFVAEADASAFSITSNESNPADFNWNADQNRLGIGPDIGTTATKTLTVFGDISASGDMWLEGNLALGNSAASHSVDGLTVQGDISASGDLYLRGDGATSELSPSINLRNDIAGFGSAGTRIEFSSGSYDADKNTTSGSALISFVPTTNSFNISNINPAGLIKLHTSGSEVARFYHDGPDKRVGIGTTTPPKTLTVQGDISASGTTFSDKFIGGKSDNTISSDADYSSILGGKLNTISGSAFYSMIGAGTVNTISGSQHSIIGAGKYNKIDYDSDVSAIVAGKFNTISNQSDYSIIGAGAYNTISKSSYSMIGTGWENTISSSWFSIIGAGRNNTISGSLSSSILAGSYNLIQGYDNVHIIGSYLTASQANTTFTENIIAKGDISASGDYHLKHTKTIYWDEDGSNQLSINGTLSQFAFLSGSTLMMKISGSAGNPYVGIGNSFPTKALTVKGSISASGDIYLGGGQLRTSTDSDVVYSIGGTGHSFIANTDDNYSFNTGEIDADFKMYDSSEVEMIRFDAGSSNVGIGNTGVPPKTLTVEGDISASGGFFLQNSASIGTAIQKGMFTVDYGSGAQITGSLTSYGDGYGDIVKMGSGTTIAGRGYTLGSDQVWTVVGVADAVSSSLTAVALGTNPTTDGMLLRGFVAAASHDTLVTGQKVYNEVNGRFAIAAGDDSGDVVRVLGYAISGSNVLSHIYFNPDNTWIEIS